MLSTKLYLQRDRHSIIIFIKIIMSIIIISCVAAIIFFVYSYTTRNRNYWKNKNVPYDEPLFFFGNYKNVICGKTHFGQMFRELYSKYQDVPYFGYFKLTTPGLVIRDPELVKTILVKDFSSFEENDFKVDPEVDPVWNANLFTQSGEVWKKNRSAWSVGMTASKIKGMHEIMFHKSNAMVDYLRNQIKDTPNKAIEAKDLMSHYQTDVVVTSVLGLESNSFHTESPFRSIIKGFLQTTFWDGIALLTFLIAPWLGKFMKFSFVPKRVEKQLLGVSRSVLENRRSAGYQKNNIFDSMLAHIGDVNSITEMDVAGFLFNFMLDGVETSSSATSYIIYCLASNPHIQTKVRNEIDVTLKKNDGKITFEDINQMTYLNMVFQESIRLYPVVLSMNRLCTKPYELPSVSPNGKPVPIPVGMSMVIPTYALHMDPEYFPDPEKFDPERFNEDNKGRIPKFAYLPFGEGPRICIGSRLGVTQIKIGLVELLRNFELRLAQKTIDNPPILDPNVFIFSSAEGIWITVHERL